VAKGKYPDDKILVIGDSNGDLKAAYTNGVLFYPINPGHEEESQQRFYREAFSRFIEGNYKGEYEKTLVAEFTSYLHERPPWVK
jgi:phosphoglycolate phosphatase-like HAD superfamily hydrolase